MSEMMISHLKLRNWRNFRDVNVDFRNRIFFVGPNASGKSNILDVFRFLRDIAKPGGGLQKAVEDRGGLSKIRCLAARQNPDVEIEVVISEPITQKMIWRYAIGIKQGVRGRTQSQPYLAYERVWERERQVCDRPAPEDKTDAPRLNQTYLEQINANKEFRDISDFFQSIMYFHLIPQLLRNPDAFTGPGVTGDPFGRSFLEKVAKTPKKIRDARLKKIEQALRIAVPQLKELKDIKDERGIPHLQAIYTHWRSQGAKQQEDQFSDGTLRLLGLFWTLFERASVLLLEEPELSLNSAIVRKIPTLISRLQQNKKINTQVMLSTHSFDLLSDPGISPEEVILLKPEHEGTKVLPASKNVDVIALLKGGMSMGDAVLPQTIPRDISQLRLEFSDK